jgi:hypothetical protein
MCRTYTAWDLGISDSMSIWFVQAAGRELRVIDYYEAAGKGLDHYAGVLSAKGYQYTKHYGPHDIQVRELGSGRSRWEIAKGLGITFDRMWFDAKKTALGVDALRQYREKMDEKRGIALGPLHDWTSHAADAMRYFCTGHQEHTAHKPLKITRKWVV